MRACVLPYVCQRSVYRTGEEGGRTEVSSLWENKQYTGTRPTTRLGLAILSLFDNLFIVLTINLLFFLLSLLAI